MERFKYAVEDLIGIQLTDEETITLYTKYKYKGSKCINYINYLHHLHPSTSSISSLFVNANDI